MKKPGVYLGVTLKPGSTRNAMQWDPLHYRGPSHLITVAPTRSGKFRDILALALMRYQGSAIMIDPKAQAASVTARGRKAQGQIVHVLNPFDIFRKKLGEPATYNPMDNLNPRARSFGADCDALADAIVLHKDADSGAHFTDSARSLVSGVIRQLAKNAAPGMRNLGAMRSIIAGPLSVLQSFCADALNSGDTTISDKLARFAAITEDDREIRSIISTAITQTDFLGNEAIAASLASSSFRFADLRKRPTTVYIVLPARYLVACGKWFRIMIAGFLDEMLQEGSQGHVPVLAILDEFAQLGRLGAIENAMSLAAGYGLQLWPILQNLGQLRELYGDAWESFLSGAGVRQFFTPRDVFTAEYVSKLCGQTTVRNVSHSSHEISQDQVENGFTGVNVSASDTQRPLLFPDEVMKLHPQGQLLFVENVPNPIKAARAPYYEIADPQTKALFDPDPYHTSAQPETRQ